MEIGKTIKLTPTGTACQRTKNRIHENGMEFIVLQTAKTCQFDRGNQRWILLESAAHVCSDGRGGKEAWQGWLPVEEIEVVA